MTEATKQADGFSPLWHRAGNIAEAQRLQATLPGAVFAAGMTALQLGWPEGVRGSRPTSPVVYISGLDMGPAVSELCDGWLRIAANAPLEQVRRAPAMAGFPALLALLDGIAATGVRGLATLGGNLKWGAGDAEAFCAAFDTIIVTASGRVPYHPNTLPDDLILAVEICRGDGFVEKIGFRAAFSPARVLLAGCRTSQGLRLGARVRGGPVIVVQAYNGGAIAPVLDALCSGTGVSAGSEDAAILRAVAAGHLKDFAR